MNTISILVARNGLLKYITINISELPYVKLFRMPRIKDLIDRENGKNFNLCFD